MKKKKKSKYDLITTMLTYIFFQLSGTFNAVYLCCVTSKLPDILTVEQKRNQLVKGHTCLQ